VHEFSIQNGTDRIGQCQSSLIVQDTDDGRSDELSHTGQVDGLVDVGRTVFRLAVRNRLMYTELIRVYEEVRIGNGRVVPG
jgi:hypothetical protein